ncbi:hypothetical protein B0H19DRAFT_1228220 [Mycena capillaripes]|nr:hypothetical protein B0H19DRAFT_1228220 [Mycena capillaripes]
MRVFRPSDDRYADAMVGLVGGVMHAAFAGPPHHTIAAHLRSHWHYRLQILEYTSLAATPHVPQVSPVLTHSVDFSLAHGMRGSRAISGPAKLWYPRWPSGGTPSAAHRRRVPHPPRMPSSIANAPLHLPTCYCDGAHTSTTNTTIPSRVHSTSAPGPPHDLLPSLPSLLLPQSRLETSGGPIRHNERYNPRLPANRQYSTPSTPPAAHCPVAMHGIHKASPSVTSLLAYHTRPPLDQRLRISHSAELSPPFRANLRTASTVPHPPPNFFARINTSLTSCVLYHSLILIL